MKRLIGGILTLLLLSGCGGSGTDWSGYAPPEAARLTVYTTHEEAVYAPVVKEFEERTGLWVQVETGSGVALLEKIAGEAEQPVCDLLLSGSVDSLQANSGLFEPYISPEAANLDEGCQCADGTWTAFSLLPAVMIYNPILVRNNPPEDWESLLDPAWRGRIAFPEPEASSSGYTVLAALLQVLPGEPLETLTAFYENLEGHVPADPGDAVAEVAEGSCMIGVAPEDAALQAVDSRSDVALLYPDEGVVCLPDGMAVVKGAPHRDNARLFIDFCLSKDVQNYLTGISRRPVRRDIPGTLADTEEFRRLDYDLDRAIREREAVLSLWRQLEEEP